MGERQQVDPPGKGPGIGRSFDCPDSHPGRKGLPHHPGIPQNKRPASTVNIRIREGLGDDLRPYARRIAHRDADQR